MTKYHAHIYFRPHQKEEARLLVARVLSLKTSDVKFFKTYDQKVGPHFLPMMEMHFTSESAEKVLNTLRLYHNDLSILVHVDSGDDFKDHERPIWVGPVLPIDFNFFHKVKADASISIH